MFPNTEQNRRLAERIGIPSLDKAAHFPKYFEIETVNACNARCVMCTINDWDKREDVIMPMPLFDKLVAEIKPYADWIETVCLNRDGEPTLDKMLAARVRKLKVAGIKKVTFSTNAQKLTPALARELIEAGLDDIMLSIDAITKETYEKIRIRLNYDVVLSNALELIRLRNELRPQMTIRVRKVILESNKHETLQWRDFWEKQLTKPGDRVYAKPAHTWGNQTDEELQSKINHFADKPCVSPFSTMVMHSDGKIALCAVDYKLKYPLGDFKAQSVLDIWQGEAFTRIRELHANEKRNEIELCRGCSIWNRDPIVH